MLTTSATPSSTTAAANHRSRRDSSPWVRPIRTSTPTTHATWKRRYAAGPATFHTRCAVAAPGRSNGCGTVRALSAYSTGHSAEAGASRAPTTVIATTTGRHRGEGSRPSGKQISVRPVSTSTGASGHTPSHCTHTAPGRPARPYWRPKNITACASPTATKSHPSRWPGRRSRTNTPTAVKLAASSPLCRLDRCTPRANPDATSTAATRPRTRASRGCGASAGVPGPAPPVSRARIRARAIRRCSHADPRWS
jgi:hypothetical protein